jgi:UDP-glucuronate 4-epimerase
MKILLTGVAGFIGFHVARQLLARGDEVIAIDSINSYYDVKLKYDRLAELGLTPRPDDTAASEHQSSRYPRLRFSRIALEDSEAIARLFSAHHFDAICNLAGQAGVRYSLEAPLTYIASNVTGTTVLLEAARQHRVGHFVFASTSSVYGLNEAMPYSTHHTADHPVSLYAATKRSTELIAHAYSKVYGLPCTGLRFFTVYGPWGRPDMAPSLFADAILHGRPIDVFNNGKMKRDFTYVSDIADGVVRVLDKPAQADSEWNPHNPDPGSSSVPWRIYNIGRGSPVDLMEFIHTMEKALGKKAELRFKPMQAGDVPATWADTEALEHDANWSPQTDLEHGVKEFVAWYRSYHGV